MNTALVIGQWRRLGVIVLVVGCMTTAWLWGPTGDLAAGPLTVPSPLGPPPLGPPPYLLCPASLAGGGFSTRLGMYSDVAVGGGLTAIGGNRDPVSIEVSDSGSFHTEVGDLAELGATPVLVEPVGGPDGLTVGLTAGTFVRAGSVAALGECATAVPGPVAVMGMATNGGESSSMILVNPFAIEASLRLAGTSEFGSDTPTVLETVRVPAFSALRLQLDQMMAGREDLTFSIEPISGSAVTAMARSGSSDIAVMAGVAGGTEWYLGLPDLGIDGSIEIRSLASVESQYRVDRIDGDGLVEGVAEGMLAPNAQLVLALSDLGASGGGFVVAATEPIAVASIYDTDPIRAVTPGVAAPALEWAVPVTPAGPEGQTAIWILNPGEQPTTAVLAPARPGVSPQTVQLPAGATTTRMLADQGGSGIRITAQAPVVVFYGVMSGSSIAMSPAVSLG